MADFSISMKKAPQRKTQYTEGTLGPNGTESLEIRVDEAHFSDKLDFWASLEKLLQRMRERGEPRF